MDIKVHRTIRIKAKIFGLDAEYFLVFAALGVLLAFYLINSFSFSRLIIVGILLSIVYLVIYLLQGKNMNDWFSNLPKTIINK